MNIKIKADSIIKPDFKTVVYGKWILSGEHAVLRGHPAIIFPVKSRELTFSYWSNTEEIRAEFNGEFSTEMQFLFWGVLERAIEILNIQHRQLTGKISINNSVPIGAGMGGSATICVAVARWLAHLQFIPEANLFEFARQLENMFHGESSGADIAVAIAGEGICYSRSGAMRPITLQWQPQWYLSYSGNPSSTSRCVNQIKALCEANPDESKRIDAMMAQSVELAEKSLCHFQGCDEERFNLLSQAMTMGHQCFKAWNLCEDFLEKHIEMLMKNGATAIKPTGAGNGGYVISLWNSEPPEGLANELIKV